MYQDDESIKVFEKQHARDRLAELARTYSGEPDTDLMTTHAASGWQEEQHARDRLAELARTYSGEPDTDLMTTHAASGWQEGWLVSAVSLVAIVILVAVVAFRLV